MDRGKAYATHLATGSNTTIKATGGTLYELHYWPTDGSTVKVNGSATMGASTDMNTSSADTLYRAGPFTTFSNYPISATFGPGVGFDGLTIATTSNARVTAVWE